MRVLPVGPGSAPAQSASIYLNGALLSVNPTTGMLPQRPISGVPCAAAAGGLAMAAYTYGFFAFSGAGASPAACA